MKQTTLNLFSTLAIVVLSTLSGHAAGTDTWVGNTSAKDEVPDEITEPDDTDQGAANDGASEPEKEAQA